MPDTIGPGHALLPHAACDSNRLRDHLAAVGAGVVIRLSLRRSTPPPRDRDAYRQGNRIERFFSKLKHCTAIATRYERHDANFLTRVERAATRIWLRVYQSVCINRCPGRPGSHQPGTCAPAVRAPPPVFQ